MLSGKSAIVTGSTSGNGLGIARGLAAKRFVTVEELAALMNFLCTDNARSITGATLPVDGGWTAH
jgi:NAD(P)-dependent dehydrogenase (short-subunit alcohol dehydrogenase family)